MNFVAVVVAAIANYVLGMFWYSPALFGKKWPQWAGLTHEKMAEMKKKGMTMGYVGAYVGSFVVAWAIAYLVGRMGIQSTASAIKLGVFLAIGFSATLRLGSVLWEGKPKQLWMMNVAYDLVGFSIMAVITALWK